jgi:polyhydroxyalkanoate synthase subunit PhaC
MKAAVEAVEPVEPVEAAGSLDMLLADAALGGGRLLRPDLSTLKFLGSLAGRPGPTLDRAKALVGELNRIARGTSSVAPAKRDRRFADPAWTDNPLLHRLVQAYLAAGHTAEDLVADAGLGWRDHERTSFLMSNLVEAAAPSNNPLLSPTAWKAAIDSGGASVLKGLRNLATDLAAAPRVPTMVLPDAFKVGVDLALTPGAVVARTPMFELIQYTPQTETVSATPLLMVPPMINKFYAMDLAPGRSLVEYLVGEGVQVFMVSWRNPDAQHADWGFDAYGQSILDALDATCAITGAERAHLLGSCSGGTVSALVAGHLAAIGRDRLASITLLVTMLDQERAGTAGAFADPAVAKAAIAAARAKGYLDGKTLAEVFAWLRPGDLIWNYWVNNYLAGRTPPAFDILFWNADTTRMSAGLHRDFVTAALDNTLTRPGAATLLGTPIDLRKVTVDTYVVAGSADHICPWRNCYTSTQLLGGHSRFVLSTNGHIAALINPPTNPKSSYQVADTHPADPDAWTAAARTERGSWWPDYVGWLKQRGGEQVAPPHHARALDAAPGRYVLET